MPCTPRRRLNLDGALEDVDGGWRRNNDSASSAQHSLLSRLLSNHPEQRANTRDDLALNPDSDSACGIPPVPLTDSRPTGKARPEPSEWGCCPRPSAGLRARSWSVALARTALARCHGDRRTSGRADDRCGRQALLPRTSRRARRCGDHVVDVRARSAMAAGLPERQGRLRPAHHRAGGRISGSPERGRSAEG